MAKQLNVNMSFTADTSKAKQAINDLQSAIQKLGYGTAPAGIDPAKFKEASAAARELAVHLNQAVNVKTGNLDLSKLNASLKSGNTSLTELTSSFKSAGATGQQAFVSLANAISHADMPTLTLNSHLETMWVTLKNVARFQISSSIMHGIIGATQRAYSYAQNLNESLNNIRIVTGQSNDQMARFAEQANKAARSLSATTLDYTNASLIYYQQGLSDSEVRERTDVTLKMANVARESAETVSEQMTAIWNNFDNGSKSLEYYADVITALGAATASSSSEISAGLNKFAAVADTVGLSYENATAALATITATTRQSADTVGTGLRTLFSRLQGLSLGDTLEDGVNLNKYSAALAKVGVQALDSSGQLRRMDDVLEDLGARWDSLTKAQQTALAQTVGGVRQYTTLVALMDNWDFMKQNQQVAAGAEGTLQQQADIYAESWEAARDRVQAALESIYGALIDEDFFIGIDHGLEHLLTGVKSFVDEFGGIRSIIIALSSFILSAFQTKIGPAIATAIQNLQILMGGASKVYGKMQSEMNTIIENEIHKPQYAPTQQQTEQGYTTSLATDQLRGYGQLQLAQTKYSLMKEKLTATEKLQAEIALQGIESQINAIEQLRTNWDAATEAEKKANEELKKHENLANIAEKERNIAQGQVNAQLGGTSRALGVKRLDNGKLEATRNTLDLAVAKHNLEEQINKLTMTQTSNIQGFNNINVDELDAKVQTVANNIRVKLSEAFLAANTKATELKGTFTSLFTADLKLPDNLTNDDGSIDAYKQKIKFLQEAFQDLFKTASNKDDINQAFKAVDAAGPEQMAKAVALLKNELTKANIPSQQLKRALEGLGVKVDPLKNYEAAVKALTAAEEKLKKVRESHGKDSDAYKNAKAELDKATKQKNEARAAYEENQKNLESSGKAFDVTHIVTGTQAFAAMTAAIGQTSTAINALRSLFTVWNNEDLSFGEKITSSLMSVSMLLPSAIGLFNNFKTAIEGVGGSILKLAVNMTTEQSGLLKTIGLRLLAKAGIDEETLAQARNTAVKGENAVAELLQEKTGSKFLAKLLAKTIATHADTAATEGSTAATYGQAAANITLWESLGPIAWILTAIIALIAALVAGLTLWSRHQEEVAKQLRETASSQTEQAKATKEQLDANNQLLKTLDEATKKYEKAKEAEEDVTSAQENMEEAARAVAEAYNIQNTSLLILTENYDKLTESINNAHKAEVAEAQRQATAAYHAAQASYHQTAGDNGDGFRARRKADGGYLIGLDNGTMTNQSTTDEYYMYQAWNKFAEKYQGRVSMETGIFGDMKFLTAGQTAEDYISIYEALSDVATEAAIAAEAANANINLSETYKAAQAYLIQNKEAYDTLIAARDMLGDTTLQQLALEEDLASITKLEDYEKALSNIKNTLSEMDIAKSYSPEQLDQLVNSLGTFVNSTLQAEHEYQELIKSVAAGDEVLAEFLNNLPSDGEERAITLKVYTEMMSSGNKWSQESYEAAAAAEIAKNNAVKRHNAVNVLQDAINNDKITTTEIATALEDSGLSLSSEQIEKILSSSSTTRQQLLKQYIKQTEQAANVANQQYLKARQEELKQKNKDISNYENDENRVTQDMVNGARTTANDFGKTSNLLGGVNYANGRGAYALSATTAELAQLSSLLTTISTASGEDKAAAEAAYTAAKNEILWRNMGHTAQSSEYTAASNSIKAALKLGTYSTQIEEYQNAEQIAIDLEQQQAEEQQIFENMQNDALQIAEEIKDLQPEFKTFTEWLTEFETQITAEGFQVDEIKSYAEYLKTLPEFYGESTEEILNFALAMKKLERGYNNLTKNGKDWLKTLQDTSKKGTPEAAEAVDGLATALSDITELDKGFFNEKWLNKHSDLIQKVIDGEKDAVKELYAETGSDFLDRWSKNRSSEKYYDELQELKDAYSDFLTTEYPTLNPGDNINSEGFKTALANMINDTSIATDTIQAMFDSMGLEPDIDWIEVKSDPDTIERAVQSGWIEDEDGNPRRISGDYSIESTGTTFKVPVINSKGNAKVKDAPAANLDNKGGGGGGGSKKPPKPERYHTVENKLQNNSRRQSAVSRDKGRAAGQARIDLLKEENKLREEALELQNQYEDEIRDWLDKDKQALIDAYAAVGLDIQFDAEGEIANFEELEKAYVDFGDESDETWKEAKEALSQYEETLDKLNDKLEEITELQQAIADAALELTQAQIELQLDVSVDRFEYLDYLLDKIDDDAYQAAEAIAILGDKTAETMKKVNTYTEGLEAILAQHGFSLADLNNLTEEDLRNANFTQSEIDQIRDWRSELLQANQDLLEMRKTIVDKLISAFDDLNEKVQKSYDNFDNYNSVLEHYKNITDLMGRNISAQSRDIMNKLNDSMLRNAKNTAAAAKKIYDDAVAANAEAQAAYQAAVASGDYEAMRRWQEVIDATGEHLQEAEEQWLSSWESALELAKTRFEETMDDLAETYSATMGGTFGSLDYLQEAYDRQKEINAQYLEDWDKLYELSKLSRDISKAIDDTDSIKAKEKLRALQAEINKLQADGTKLSEYDVQVLKKRFELEQARLALDDAQHAKSQVRLQRDANGNWGYVYTADEDEVAKAEQEYEDKLHEYQELNAQYLEQLQDEALNVQQTWQETVGQIRNDLGLGLITEEEAEARLEEINKWLEEQQAYFAEQSQHALDNQASLYTRTLETYNVANAEIVDTWEETNLAMLTKINSLGAYMQNWNTAVQEYLANTEEALSAYQDNIDKINDSAGVTTAQFENHIDNVVVDLNNLSDDTVQNVSDLSDAMKNEFANALMEAVLWEQKYVDGMDAMITRNEQFVKSINLMIEALAGVDTDTVSMLSPLSLMENTINQSTMDLYKGTLDQYLSMNKNQILSMIDLNANAMAGGLGTMSLTTLPALSENLEQNVTITAQFPNATNHNEIEEAFTNLINKASQYANRKGL